MNMLEFCQRAAAAASMELPTKEQFGELMHDDTLTDEQKWEIVRKMEEAGGYECLQDEM